MPLALSKCGQLEGIQCGQLEGIQLGQLEGIQCGQLVFSVSDSSFTPHQELFGIYLTKVMGLGHLRRQYLAHANWELSGLVNQAQTRALRNNSSFSI